MSHVKHHAKHILMCAPMIVLAIVLIGFGAGWAVLLPVLGCVLMMGAMMGMMGSMGSRQRARNPQDPGAD